MKKIILNFFFAILQSISLLKTYTPDFSRVSQFSIPKNITKSLKSIIRTLPNNDQFITHIAMSPKLIGRQIKSQRGCTVKGCHLLFEKETALENKTYFNDLFIKLFNVDFLKQKRDPESFELLVKCIISIIEHLNLYGEDLDNYSQYIHIQNINFFNNSKYKNRKKINHKIEYKDICEVRFNYTAYPEIAIVIVFSLKNKEFGIYKIKTMYPQRSTLDQIKHSILSGCKSIQNKMNNDVLNESKYPENLDYLDQYKNELFKYYGIKY